MRIASDEFKVTLKATSTPAVYASIEAICWPKRKATLFFTVSYSASCRSARLMSNPATRHENLGSRSGTPRPAAVLSERPDLTDTCPGDGTPGPPVPVGSSSRHPFLDSRAGSRFRQATWWQVAWRQNGGRGLILARPRHFTDPLRTTCRAP